jgi:hypothetical protein
MVQSKPRAHPADEVRKCCMQGLLAVPAHYCFSWQTRPTACITSCISCYTILRSSNPMSDSPCTSTAGRNMLRQHKMTGGYPPTAPWKARVPHTPPRTPAAPHLVASQALAACPSSPACWAAVAQACQAAHLAPWQAGPWGLGRPAWARHLGVAWPALEGLRWRRQGQGSGLERSIVM